MKTYNQTNFFKHTFCEFKEITNFKIPENINFSSKSDSTYFYTNEGVYRKSNHWGRVANCRWKLISTANYKNQEVVVALQNGRTSTLSTPMKKRSLLRLILLKK